MTGKHTLPRAAFFMEQHIGHHTYYQNLRRYIQDSPLLAPRWVEVTYENAGSLWERLPLPRRLQGPLSGRHQVRSGLREGYDVAFFNTQVPAAIAGSAARQRPYLLSVDITPIQYDAMGEHYGHHADRFALLSRMKHHYNRTLFQHAARILPWSNWVRASLIADYGVQPQQIEVIPPGVDTEVWRPCGQRPGGQHANAALRILFVGADLNRKGGLTLLEAFRQLPPGMAELHLVTRTPVASEAGVTVYDSMQPNAPALRALYKQADVFVLPTQAEAFGIAAVEASASGLPVIATRIGGLTDIVVHGETGLLIQPGDSAALAEALRHLAADAALRRQMGQAGRARVEEHFCARKNANRILEILLETAGNHAKP